MRMLKSGMICSTTFELEPKELPGLGFSFSISATTSFNSSLSFLAMCFFWLCLFSKTGSFVFLCPSLLLTVSFFWLWLSSKTASFFGLCLSLECVFFWLFDIFACVFFWLFVSFDCVFFSHYVFLLTVSFLKTVALSFFLVCLTSKTVPLTNFVFFLTVSFFWWCLFSDYVIL